MSRWQKKMNAKAGATLAAALMSVAWVGQAQGAVFEGTVNTDFTNTNNWDTLAWPGTGDQAYIDTVADMTNAAPNGIQAIRVGSGSGTTGVLNMYTNASLNATTHTSWDSHIGSSGNGTLNMLGGEAYINFGEVGRNSGSTGIVNVVEGYLRFTRGSRDGRGYSLHLGSSDNHTAGGQGMVEVSGGTFLTRFGIEVGNETGTGDGTFSVQGTNATAITIGDTNEGLWQQFSNSTFRVGIDGGVTPVTIGNSGGVRFEEGAILDAGFINGYTATGTWPIMVTDGSIINLGLALTDEAVAAGWDAGIESNILYVSYGEDAPGDLAPPSSPLAPNNVTALPSGNYEVTITWDAAVGSPDSYTVQRSTTSGGPYTVIATGVAGQSYVDTTPKVDERYYYTVYGVNGFGDGLLSGEDDAYAIDATIIDSGATTYGDVYESYSMFDDDTSTHYDTKTADAWAGLDFGAGNEKQFVEIRYATRNYTPWDSKVLAYASNCTFQVANSNDWSDAVTLYTVPQDIDAPPAWNVVSVSDVGSYRYVRVLSAPGVNNKAFAEVQFLTTDDFTANGTPHYWLDSFYDVDADFGGDYVVAEASDSDSDGLTAGEEYVAGTDPTDPASVLEVNTLETTGGLIISWQSVAGKSYSVITNTSLVYPAKGTIATGIIGLDGETSYTGTVSGASSVFYEIGVE